MAFMNNDSIGGAVVNNPGENSGHKAVDTIQQRLVDYARDLNYDSLTPGAIHAVKVRVVDTLGVLIGGFFSADARIARNIVAEFPNPNGATVIGTRMKTAPDLAAFVNGTTARYLELTDSNPQQKPKGIGGHPSDVVTPIFSAAEYAHSSGRDLIAGIVLAYEIYMRFYDVVTVDMGFDHTNMCCLGTAMATARFLGLSPEQFAHCISMAVVPNNALRITRVVGDLSMWKVAATGQAGRAGIFAALLARGGMEGPRMPFEGKSGWCDHVGTRFALNAMGGNGTPFKVELMGIKMRPCIGLAISAVLAAEKISPLRNIENVKEVTLETWKQAVDGMGVGAHNWNPDTKETADHSGPYVIAATLMDGTLTPRSYNDAHLWNPQLRALMQKIRVIDNPDFTKAYFRMPPQHHSRVTVVTHSGERLVGESADEKDDLSTPKSDAQISEKFRSLTEDYLGAKRVNAILERLWNLENLSDVAVIPPDFVLD